MNKKIMILEPDTTAGKLLVRTAKKLNFEVVGVTTVDVYETYSQELRLSLNKVMLTQFIDLYKARKDIVAFASENNVQGVVSGFEFFSDLAVEVATDLGLPTNNIEFSKVYRDKYLMAKLFAKVNIPSAKTIRITDDVDLYELDYPLIAKPSKNAGSCFVKKVNTPAELQEIACIISKNDKEFPHGFQLKSDLLVQEILDGPEFSVEVISVNGMVHVLCVTDKITTHGDFFAEVGHILPSCVDKITEDKISRVAVKAVTALGVTDGVAHVEVILTSTGPKIVEVGARLPGDYIPNILLDATGINEAELYLKVALGMPVNVERKWNKYSGVRFIRNQHSGKIKKFDVAANIEVTKYVNVGDYVEQSPDNVSRLGHYSTTKDCYRSVTHDLKKALANTEVVYEKNCPD